VIAVQTARTSDPRSASSRFKTATKWEPVGEICINIEMLLITKI